MNTTPAFARTRPAPSPAALAALSLRDAIALNVAAASRKAAPFAASHAQIATELQPVVNNLLDLGRPFVEQVWRAYPQQIAGTWAAHVLAECKSAWACDDAQDEAEAAAWNADMEQLRWAEAGGYAAGLARPCARRPAPIPAVDDGSNDIPF